MFNLDYEKPRKLDEETIKYLLEIENTLNNLEITEKDVFISNVLEEIKNRIASVASDRNINLILEKICFNCNIKQLYFIINKCIQYNIFLTINRYSSHVIQVDYLSYLLLSPYLIHSVTN